MESRGLNLSVKLADAVFQLLTLSAEVVKQEQVRGRGAELIAECNHVVHGWNRSLLRSFGL